MAEGARLESVYTATYRGFESPPHRHIRDESLYESTGSFLLYSPQGGMRTPDRGSTTGNASWTDREPASGLPRRGERSESIPPSPPYFKKSSYESTGFFSHVAPAKLPGFGINVSPGLPIPQAAPPVARPSAAPPGGCSKDNKARASPGFAQTMTINNRLSASAGREPSAHSHRW